MTMKANRTTGASSFNAAATVTSKTKDFNVEKDEVLKMISKLEFGENSDTFRSLAKQFYI